MADRHLRFVAHIDILGMSAIMEKDADEAWTLLSDLIDLRDEVGNFKIKFLHSNEQVIVSEAIHTVTFSDTVMLFTNGDSDTELRCMIVLVTEMLNKAMFRCVPVRAGLSYGKFFFNIDKSMYAGPALIEAYRVGESAQWLGICLSESVREKATMLKMMSGRSNVIVEWPVPLKAVTERRSVVNWPALIAHNLKVKPPVSVAQFYQAFERSFGPFAQLPAEVQAKYENTVKFMNEQLALHVMA